MSPEQEQKAYSEANAYLCQQVLDRMWEHTLSTNETIRKYMEAKKK